MEVYTNVDYEGTLLTEGTLWTEGPVQNIVCSWGKL